MAVGIFVCVQLLGELGVATGRWLNACDIPEVKELCGEVVECYNNAKNQQVWQALLSGRTVPWGADIGSAVRFLRLFVQSQHPPLPVLHEQGQRCSVASIELTA